MRFPERPLRPTRHRSARLVAAIAAGALTALSTGLAGSSPFAAQAASGGSTSSASAGQLQQRIAAGRRRVSGLTGAVAAATGRVDRLNASVAGLQTRLTMVQNGLDGDRSELLTLRAGLESARARLTRLEALQTRDQQVLAGQLIGSYETGRPDLVTVVLSAHGFNDLLEALDFARRIGHQDAQIVSVVRASRRAVAAQATRLGTLSARQQRLADVVLTERNRVASIRLSLVSQQIAAVQARAVQASRLTSAHSQLAALDNQLVALEARQRAEQAAAVASNTAATSSSAAESSAASASTGSPSAVGGASASAPSSGGFTFPMPKADVSPPGTWSLDDGVDISAPGGTLEVAVCSGTVVLHGIGGFGPSAPVLHCDSPIAGCDYVYYGHAGPGDWVPIGTHLRQGQMISEVGYGLVGISTGPHLEIGFADSSGSPIGPSSAPAMMSLLQAAYAG